MVCTTIYIILLTGIITLVQGDQQLLKDKLNRRIDALEKQGEALLTYIQNLKGQIEQQRENSRSQDVEIAELKGQINRQNIFIEELQHKQRQSNHGNLQNAHSRQGRLLLDPSENIVFYANINKTSLDAIAVNQAIVFETAPTNLGGGYSTQTGVFIAPRPGIYLLSTSFVSYLGHHHEIHLAVMHNGQEIGRVMAHGDSGHLDQGSTVLVTPLNAGDKVWLKNVGDPDNSLGGNGYSNFMGVLLYQM